jgi:hypothetical protein
MTWLLIVILALFIGFALMSNVLTTINAKAGHADVTINGVSYNTILREFEVESITNMIDSSVFSIEGVPTQDPGMEQLHFRLTGIGKFGSAESGPLIPAPQYVPLVFTYTTGCFITIPSSNFERSLLRRTVNANAVLTAEGLSNGAFTVTWVKA